MTEAEFHVAISDDKNPALLVGMNWVRRVESSWLLRDPIAQWEYLNIQREGRNPGIIVGWQENKYPYGLLTATMHILSGFTWLHLVHAVNDSDYNLDFMRSFLKFKEVNEWLIFINPDTMQSQRQINHGHAIVPSKEKYKFR